MVSGSRYLAHHTARAKEIEEMLKPFGFVSTFLDSGHYGFWCRESKRIWKSRTRASSMGCIACEYSRFCQTTPPPLTRRIDIEAEVKYGKPPRDDWGLHAIWHGWRSRSLSHPELHGNNVRQEDEPKYDLSPELEELLGWGYRNLDVIRKKEGW